MSTGVSRAGAHPVIRLLAAAAALATLVAWKLRRDAKRWAEWDDDEPQFVPMAADSVRPGQWRITYANGLVQEGTVR